MQNWTAPTYTSLPKSVKLKNSLLRAYSSKKIQIFYTLLIILCIADLTSACVYFIISGKFTIWTNAFDLILNILILLDCLTRVWIKGFFSSWNFKEALIELIVIILSIPDIILIIMSMFSPNTLGYILGIVSLSFTGLVLLLRPLLLFKLKKKSVIQSVYLPTSILEDLNPEKKSEVNPVTENREHNRIDSSSALSWR